MHNVFASDDIRSKLRKKGRCRELVFQGALGIGFEEERRGDNSTSAEMSPEI